MRRLIGVVVFVALLGSSVIAGDGIFPFDYRLVELENGFKAYLIHAGAPGQVAYVTMVRTGSRDEWEEGRSGFAHFFEHVMFRGTKKYPHFDEILTGIGANSNAFTSNDMTVFHMVASSDSLPLMVDLESDRFMNLDYEESAFRTEAGAVLGEFNQGQTNAFNVLFEKISETAFDKHTYRHTTIGFEADVRAMPEGFEYSRSFFKRYYRPENVILVLVGDFDYDKAEGLIRKHYGPWTPGYQPPRITPEPPQTAPRRAIAEFSGQTLPILSVNYKGPAWNPRDRSAAAIELLGQIAFGPNSDIYRQLIIERQQAQAFFGDFGLARDPALLSVIAMASDPSLLPGIERDIENTVQRFRRRPPSQEQLDRTRSAFKYNFLMGLETAEDTALALMPAIINTGSLEAVEDYFRTMESVTPEDVRAAAEKYLVAEGRTIVTLVSKGTELPAPDAASGGEEVAGAVLMPEEGSPFVAFDIWLKIGSQNDPAGKEGLASLTAEVLSDSSTLDDSYEKILEKLYPMSAGYSASTDKEMTVFRGTVHRDNLEEYYALFKNALLKPAFKQEDFDRIKAQRMSFLTRQRRFSSDEELGKELLFREIFRGTHYEHPEEGYVQSVQSISLDDVRDFYAKHYRRGNVMVGVAGGYEGGFARRVRGDFDQLPEGSTEPVAAPQPADIEGIHVLIVEKDVAATAISLGFPIDFLRSDSDFYPMMLFNSWLGEHRNSSSHLYQVIRETRGMNYGDYSYIEAYPMGHRRTMPPQNVARRRQIFQIWIRPVSRLKPGDLHDRGLFALKAALRELRQLLDHGLSEEEFETARNFVKHYTVNYGATISQRLGYRIDDAFYSIADPGHLMMIRPEMDKLDRRAVHQAIRKHLQDRNMWMVFITKDAEGLRDKLVNGAVTPIEYPGQKPKSVLAEDRVIQSFAVPIKAKNVRIIKIDDVLEK